MAANGMVGPAADYCRADRKKVGILDAMKDVDSSVRWLRTYAEDLNVDPEKKGIRDFCRQPVRDFHRPVTAVRGASESAETSSVPNMVNGVCLAVAVASRRKDLNSNGVFNDFRPVFYI
jgi:hypothetical protein